MEAHSFKIFTYYYIKMKEAGVLLYIICLYCIGGLFVYQHSGCTRRKMARRTFVGPVAMVISVWLICSCGVN